MDGGRPTRSPRSPALREAVRNRLQVGTDHTVDDTYPFGLTQSSLHKVSLDLLAPNPVTPP